MHIVFVAPFGLKHKTTVWARTLPIAQTLVARGYTATILIPPWDSPEDAGKEETISGVCLKQVTLNGGLLGTLHQLLKAVDQANPYIVHIVKPRAHAGLVQWWLLLRRRSSRPKIVLDVDDWEQAWNPVNYYNALLARFLTWQEEWGIRHADGITTASRWLEQKVRAVAPQIPTLYLPNGVERQADQFVNLQPSPVEGPQILFFTRYMEISPQWLRDFWQTLHRRLPTAELIMAGSPIQPWLFPPFQEALAGLPQVLWMGYVPPNELPELYASITCAIFPAAPVPLMQAKCSVKLANTLLHGVPVIASSVGEQANYGAEGAATLLPVDATPAEFAQAVIDTIHTTVHDPIEQAALRAKATERLLARYAWSHLTEDLPAFYESLSGQR